MDIKSLLKKNTIINSINAHLKARDYIRERKFFLKNYMYSKPITKEKLEYSMLLEIHGLEKGFTVKDGQRPFGVEKVKKIIKSLGTYENVGYAPSFAYELAYSLLNKYKAFYEDRKWTQRDEYRLVSDFLHNRGAKYNIPVGALDYRKKDFIRDARIDYDKFISSRKSVRNYARKRLSDEDIKKAVSMAIKTPTACNRQMCKIYYIKSVEGAKVVEQYAQGLKLFDMSSINYFVVTFDVSANYFVGEKSQGWFNSGLMTMNFINALHSLGIGTCCIQFANTFKEEESMKRKLSIPNTERISVILAAGYYADVSRVPYSARKPLNELYRER